MPHGPWLHEIELPDQYIIAHLFKSQAMER